METNRNSERAGLVGCYFKSRERLQAEESLDELQRLAEAAGAQVIERFLQERPAPDPAYFIGRGKAEELARRAEADDIDLYVFDEELSPGQQRNLENRIGRKILDRTQLILDIFARRARSSEGKLQVELAQLTYLLPRLTGKGTMLSRLGGGIGTRGPGETKLEMDRRRIRSRIAKIRRDLGRVGTQRRLQRSKRKGVPLPVVALVGYTNAGKSTLFNALTRARTLESPRLFATLDPLMRRVELPNSLEVVFSDTVGFVRKLPHDIVAAFRATLEEVREADVLLHVIDISSSDWRGQRRSVEEVLRELGIGGKTVIEAYNKADLLPAGSFLLNDQPAGGRSVLLSAKEGTGLESLLEQIMQALKSFSVRVVLVIPYGNAGLVARIHEEGKIISEVYEKDGIKVEAEIPASAVRALNRWLKE